MAAWYALPFSAGTVREVRPQSDDENRGQMGHSDDRWAKPVVLENDLLRLEPLSLEHTDDLYQVGCDERIWEFTTQPPFGSSAEVAAWIEETLLEVSEGRQVAFAIIH